MSCKKSISKNEQTNIIKEQAEINCKRRVDEFDEGLIKIPSDPRLAYETGLKLGFTDCAELIHEEAHEYNPFDWHKIRIQAAIAAMQGICASPVNVVRNETTLAEMSVKIADKLVEALKR